MVEQDSNMGYEEIRRRRLEENKKRLQELGITEISESMSRSAQATNSVNKIPKSRAPKDEAPTEIRRSSRVANGPQPDYREGGFDFLLPRRSYSRSDHLPRRIASDIERVRTAEQAYKLQEELQSGNPSFVKLMLQSHVSGGFWLGLPLKFCKNHLPENDVSIVLEDAKGDEWESVYLAHRTGLSGGWRGFAMDHYLEDGDAIVFERINLRRLKVHIIRASEVDTSEKECVAPKDTPTKANTSRKRKLESSDKDIQNPKGSVRNQKVGSKTKKRNIKLKNKVKRSKKKS